MNMIFAAGLIFAASACTSQSDTTGGATISVDDTTIDLVGGKIHTVEINATVVTSLDNDALVAVQSTVLNSNTSNALLAIDFEPGADRYLDAGTRANYKLVDAGTLVQDLMPMCNQSVSLQMCLDAPSIAAPNVYGNDFPCGTLDNVQVTCEPN